MRNATPPGTTAQAGYGPEPPFSMPGGGQRRIARGPCQQGDGEVTAGGNMFSSVAVDFT